MGPWTPLSRFVCSSHSRTGFFLQSPFWDPIGNRGKCRVWGFMSSEGWGGPFSTTDEKRWMPSALFDISVVDEKIDLPKKNSLHAGSWKFQGPPKTTRLDSGPFWSWLAQHTAIHAAYLSWFDLGDVLLSDLADVRLNAQMFGLGSVQAPRVGIHWTCQCASLLEVWFSWGLWLLYCFVP